MMKQNRFFRAAAEYGSRVAMAAALSKLNSFSKDLRRAGKINAEQLREPSHQMPPPTDDKNLVVTDFCEN